MLAKIAVMMLVHKNENQINRLIKHLSNDLDVFVHIDKNCSLKINTKNNVFAYKKYRTYWGSYNQIMATLYLLKEAHRKGYERYILISGQDLPIKTNAEIIAFFENNNNEYLSIRKIPDENGWPNMNRVTDYNLGVKITKYNLLLRLYRKLLYIISKVKPREIDYDFYGGDNWTNYTHECVKKILKYLENDKNYTNRFRWTSCADEIFYQTIIHKLDGLDIINDRLRYIDWETGPEYPKILRTEDYEKIINSNAMFARKFNENIDKEIIDKIYKTIGE